MFQIWLSYIVTNAGLDQSDKVYILIDVITAEYIDTCIQISHLIKKSACPICFIHIQQPLTISQGMVERYRAFDDNDQFLYLDMDVLVVKSLKEIPALSSNQLLLVPEGVINHGLYAGHILPEPIEPICGFTSGIFGFYPGEEVYKFFELIRTECLQYEKVLYTVDQPFFNKWIYLTITKRALALELVLLRDKVSQNTNEEYPGILFLNYAGAPGDGNLHYTKMMNKFCVDFISSR